MVRQPVYRIKKYDGKVVGDVLKARIDVLKPMMLEQEEVKLSELVNVENIVKGIIEPKGVSTIHIAHYLNFGRELYGLTQRFTANTLALESKLAYEKWKARGLEADILKAIASAFGIDTTTWS